MAPTPGSECDLVCGFVLSILVWWAIPAFAVLSAAAVLTVSRRVRRAREDVGALDRYQRARQVLERTQQSAGLRSHVNAQPHAAAHTHPAVTDPNPHLARPNSHPPSERASLPTAE